MKRLLITLCLAVLPMLSYCQSSEMRITNLLGFKYGDVLDFLKSDPNVSEVEEKKLNDLTTISFSYKGLAAHGTVVFGRYICVDIMVAGVSEKIMTELANTVAYDSKCKPWSKNKMICMREKSKEIWESSVKDGLFVLEGSIYPLDKVLNKE